MWVDRGKSLCVVHRVEIKYPRQSRRIEESPPIYRFANVTVVRMRKRCDSLRLALYECARGTNQWSWRQNHSQCFRFVPRVKSKHRSQSRNIGAGRSHYQCYHRGKDCHCTNAQEVQQRELATVPFGSNRINLSDLYVE